jgi:hypothetical protein
VELSQRDPEVLRARVNMERQLGGTRVIRSYILENHKSRGTGYIRCEDS